MKKIFLTVAVIVFHFSFFTINSSAQSWNLTGNAGTTAGTNFIGTTDAKDFVFKTNNTEKGRVKSNGLWQFGASGNLAKFDSAGNLSFAGNAAYKVAGNKYAFQFAGNPNFGLFFNSTLTQYEFRNSTAAPVFFVNANNGNGTFNGTLKVGSYTLPGTDGTNGQVLKSNGAGVLSWSDDNGTAFTSGTGINISAGTITNTAPDQTVTLSGTGATTVSGAYPNFTINSIDNNTVYTAGAGIGIVSNVITNTSPDQTVVLTGANGISISGSYPTLGISGAGLWSTTGNSGTIAGTNFIGTADASDLVFKTNNVERMRFNSSTSRIGIGTVTPIAKLHVKLGSSGTFFTSAVNTGLLVENSTTAEISILAPSGSNRVINFGDNLNFNDGAIIYTGTQNAFNFITNGAQRMTLDSSGNLSITGNKLKFGSVESFADSGANVIACNSDFVNTIDAINNSLGSSSKRWVDVWSLDGSINTSDVREKNNIKDLNYGLQEIMKLHPVTFNWIKRPEAGTKIGLIAQELQQVLPEVVKDSEWKSNEETGVQEKVPSAILGVMYDDIIPVMIKGMQELAMENENIKSENTELKSRLDKIENQMQQFDQSLSQCCTNHQSGVSSPPLGEGLPKLEQNIPNPFSQNTVIKYYLPQTAKSGVIKIYSMEGVELKSFAITQTGFGQITVTGSSLASGVYVYTLIIDGKAIDTKQMILTKN